MKSLSGQVCSARFARSGLPGQVCWARVAQPGLLGQGCLAKVVWPGCPVKFVRPGLFGWVHLATFVRLGSFG